VIDTGDSVVVVIPTFNRPEKTYEAVQSAIAQSYSVSEIVVVDDGSSIKCRDELREKLSNLPVRLIEIDRSCHPGNARQIGISNSISKWIAFLDSDDVWLPNKIELQIEFARRNNIRAICSNAFINSENNSMESLLQEVPNILKLKVLLKSNLIVTSSVLIDRNVIQEVGGFVKSYPALGAEDYATWLRVATKTNWAYLDKSLVLYDKNSMGSISNSNIFTNDFSRMAGILDFASWQKVENKKKLMGFRALMKLSTKLITR
jgi:glycosyltransferase involved in cell wall biosynthesis